MSDCEENRTVLDTAENGAAGRDSDQKNVAAVRRSRRVIRFGLLELLLLTAVIAAWLPVIIARRQIPGLESEIQSMRLASMELIVIDEQKLSARTLPSIWHNISSWKYAAPPGADLELRLATEGINEIAFPADYQAIALPEGEHAIHLKATSDAAGYHTDVYVDDDLVLQQQHGRDWLASWGSSSSGHVSQQSTAYPLDQPLKLKVQRYSVKHPLQNNQSLEIPREYDNKGNYLWISPRSIVPGPPPRFFVPQSRYSQDAIGHRQGIKVRRSNLTGLVGLICVEPSLDSTFGDSPRGFDLPLGISVRPVLENKSDPEIPEEQSNPNMPTNLGIAISLRDTIATPAKHDGVSVGEPVTTKAISADGASMRLFAHFQPFASGAKPIVEILFDAEHPDRVGFLPHAAPDSARMEAVQFVTQFDARYYWREIEMLPDSEHDTVAMSTTPVHVPLSALYPEVDFSKITGSGISDLTPLPWQNIPLARLPRVKPTNSTSEAFKLSLITDVADSSKLTFPFGVSPQLRYRGIANRQVWRLPAAVANDASGPGITADVRAAIVLPTTTIAIPGGPAIGNVRITVPIPATQPVWLEIVAESSTSR